MCIIMGFSKQWEGISNNQKMRSSLPNKVSSESRWQFQKRYVHETATVMVLR
jgi:hypothetical protein